MRLKDRVALVTGSSGGLGKAMALGFAREGAHVTVNYHSNEAGAKDTCEKIKAMGRKTIVVKADVANKAEVDAMVKEVLKQFGGIDILVNNAGYHGVNTVDNIQTVTEDDWDRVMDINLKGALNCVKAVIPHMIRKRYGKIINIAAAGGMITGPGPGTAGLSYAVSKGALNVLTRRLAVELGQYNINVNSLQPGNIQTGAQHRNRTKEELEVISKTRVQKIVLGRLGREEDVTDAAIFLASDESSFTTGQVLNVEGGRIDIFSRA